MRFPNPPHYWKKDAAMEFPPGSGNLAGWMYTHRLVDGFHVMVSKAILDNNEEWLHVSVARTDRLPSWDEISKIKTEFMGDEVEAYHVIPKRSEYVNLHKYCIHIWAPFDGKSRVATLHSIKLEVAI